MRIANECYRWADVELICNRWRQIYTSKESGSLGLFPVVIPKLGSVSSRRVCA